MDVKKEDTTAESKKNHILYYRSLCNMIVKIQRESEQEVEQAVKNHLKGRIDAMQKDQERIKSMFPDISQKEWDGTVAK